MDKACDEAFTNHLSLKESVRHIGNAFLNVVETSQPISSMSREVIFIQTATPNERTFLIKSKEKL